MTTQNDLIEFLENFVDLLMPELTPHEASMYIFLYRNSFLLSDSGKVRIGQRTIAQKYGRGPKMAVPSRTHVTRQLEQLQEKGCIKIGDTTREGTLYTVIEPKNVPLVIEKISATSEPTIEDYYTDNAKRHELYERDNWQCQYCGEKLNKDNITLDIYSQFGPRIDKEGGADTIGAILFYDIPFSFVADTIILPYTCVKQITHGNIWNKEETTAFK